MEENTNEFLKRLEDEIWQQTRNGRTEVYLLVDDLNRLGYGIDPKKENRAWVDVKYVNIAIGNYKRNHFKESLKVDINKCSTDNMTYREFVREIKSIERGEKE